uniref:Sorbitol dehydrogenase n=1 Tax=Nicoletia phytophila TaxID=1350298 RepID=A0A481SZP0_9INSE|nr:alcohol dehydrogenase [Nicoletia phytophila]
MTDNLSAILYKKQDLRLEQRPIPTPKDDEVLLKIHSVGICGSDVHYWADGQVADFVVKAPMVLGHESSGVVESVGKKVTHLKPGDRVAIEPGVPCRTCKFCKNGRYNLCADVVFCATPPWNGNLCRYYTHAADFCYKLPDNMTLEEGALLEPLSVGVHACRRAGVTLGSKVLVTGAGPIGLVSMMAARALGATKVIMIDLVKSRLEVAKQLGADHVVHVTKTTSKEEAAAKILDALGEQPDKVIECSGAQASIRIALEVTESAGVIALVGHGEHDINISIADAACREVEVRGVFRYVNEYPLSLAMVASGKVDVKKLITHRFKLEDTLEAYETARTGAGGAIKVVINCVKQ